MNGALVQWLMAPEAEGVRLTLEDFLGRPEWHQRAACRSAGPSVFVRGPKATYEAVRALCRDCPVRQECLEAALADSGDGSPLTAPWG